MWVRVWNNWNFYILLVGMQSDMNNLGNWSFLSRLKIEWSYNAAIPFLGIYPREVKTNVHTKLVHEYSLFLMTKNYKEPKCPSTGKWIKKLWYSHIREDYSALKKEWTIDTCSNINYSPIIVLSKRARNKWVFAVWFNFISCSRKGESIRTESRFSGWGSSLSTYWKWLHFI